VFIMLYPLRTLISWSLLLILPMQAIGWVTMDARGPAHTHQRAGADPATTLATADVDALDLSPPTRNEAAHQHQAVAHHHHPDAVDVIRQPEADLHYDALALEEGSGPGHSAWSAPIASMGLHGAMRGSHPLPNDLTVLFQSRHPQPLDRPPAV
jgi:hypothetical protein